MIIQRQVAGLSDGCAGTICRACPARSRVAWRGQCAGDQQRELRRLNHRFRGKNKPTDVLSFPADPGLVARALPGISRFPRRLRRRMRGDLGIPRPRRSKFWLYTEYFISQDTITNAIRARWRREEAAFAEVARLARGTDRENGRDWLPQSQSSIQPVEYPLLLSAPSTDANERLDELVIAFALLLLLGLLTLVSYVDRVYAEIGKFLSREFQDNIDAFEQNVEPRLGVSRARASLSMAVLTQMTMAAIAMLVGFTVFRDRAWSIYEILQATLSLILIVIIFNRFLPFVFFSRTNGAMADRAGCLLLRVLIYLVLPVTLVLGFLQSVAALTKEHTDEQPESQAEAVDALIEAGQEEGILMKATAI